MKRNLIAMIEEGMHTFSKTAAEHDALKVKYGY